MGEYIGKPWVEFDKYVEAYTTCERLPKMEYDPIIQDILNVPMEVLISTDVETLEVWAFKLEGYALYLHSFLNRDAVKMEWCEDVIHHIMAKDYDHAAMIKYELRRQITIQNNDYLGKVERVRNRLAVRVSTLRGQISHLTSMSDKLSRMANRRKYD